MPAFRMFCGELDGDLCLGHIASRADTVRHSVGEMFQPLDPLRGWRLAVRGGWKVVNVRVEKIEPGTRR